MEITRINPGHELALARFFSSLCEHGANRFFQPHDMTAAGASALVHYSGKDLYFAVTDAGEVLAYGLLRGWDEGYTVPSLGIAIRPSCQRQGLGRLLMNFLHVAARRRGASKVRLRVARENEAALRLYKSLGYEFGDTDSDYLTGFLQL